MATALRRAYDSYRTGESLIRDANRLRQIVTVLVRHGFGAIVRERAGSVKAAESKTNGKGYQVIIAHHDIVIEANDHVIVFVVNKRMVPKVEKLFQVNLGFF